MILPLHMMTQDVAEAVAITWTGTLVHAPVHIIIKVGDRTEAKPEERLSMTRSLLSLIAIAQRHAETEAGQDIDAIMATMEGEPVYELYPLGKRFSGMANTRRYYEHFIGDVQQRMRGAVLRSEAFGADGAVQEYTITLVLAGETEPSTHRIMAILTFGEQGLTGERMYSDDAFFRTLVGPLWDDLETIDLDA